MTSIATRIEGSFQGWNGGAIFRLANGQTYQQSRHKYRYRYAYRPKAKLTREGGRIFLEVQGMPDSVEVVPVELVWEGTIVSEFTGFSGDSVFELSNGQVWKQAEYKYEYHYAYRPEAFIVDGLNGIELHVEDMDEAVQVRRVR